jgi:hypothetical protein
MSLPLDSNVIEVLYEDLKWQELEWGGKSLCVNRRGVEQLI